MGTPEFAVASLDALVKAGHTIAAVVTAADKPAGRGQKLQESAVKQYAVANNLPLLQPVKLKDPEFLTALRSFDAELQVVVAFRMLPEVVWNMPPKGTINLHGSLLPQYRGAAPINWAIINGESESGVTTFFLKHEIDTGDILLNRRVTIQNDTTAGELHDELMQVGAELLAETVALIETGDYNETPQEAVISKMAMSQELHHAPKIFKEDCRIDWNQSAETIHNRIRGLSPYPTAFSTLIGKNVKLFRSEVVAEQPSIQPGEYLTDGKTFLQFAAKDAFVRILELQLEGKKRMGIQEFLRGVQL